MKNIRSFVLLSLFTLAFLSCQPPEDPTTAMRDQVMVVHDEVMPLTANVNQAIQDLQEMTTDSSENKLKLVLQLRNADKGMFDWMGAFEDPDKSLPLETRIAYYESELEKITTVANDMTRSLEAFKAYVNGK